MNVVPIRQRLVSLQDISGLLRKLADDIDADEVSDVVTLMILTEKTGGELMPPLVLGDMPDRARTVGLLQMAVIKAGTE